MAPALILGLLLIMLNLSFSSPVVNWKLLLVFHQQGFFITLHATQGDEERMLLKEQYSRCSQIHKIKMTY